MRWRLISLLLTLLTVTNVAVDAAEPRIEVVTGELAPPLEQHAAEYVAGALERLYQADVSIVHKPSGKVPVVFVGSPAHNKALAATSFDWPKLEAQEHLVKSFTLGDQPALAIGGDTPSATFWAAAEYLHELGVRTMLYGDLDPITPRPLPLGGIDLKLKPQRFTTRGWQLGGNLPIETISWSHADLQRLIGQLAKLKFTTISVVTYPDQPWTPLEFAGVRKTKLKLWDAPPLPVSGDTAGRAAFQGAKFFENPDFAGKVQPEDQFAAGKTYLQAVIDTAHSYGMTVSVRMGSEQPPQEFAPPAPGMDDLKLWQAQQSAFGQTFPALDQVYSYSGAPTLRLHTPQPAKTRPLRVPPVRLRRLLQTDDGVLVRDKPQRDVILPLSSQLTTILPQASPGQVYLMRDKFRELTDAGYIGQVSNPGDVDFIAYVLSRSACDERTTLTELCQSLLTPVCGEEVHTRVEQAMQAVEQADLLIELNDPDLGNPQPDMILRHYAAQEKAPEWWGKVREAYLQAMNEMYRANTRARDGSRSYTLYLARRYEFGFEFMNCLQAVRAAAVARQEKDKDQQIAELEKAIDSLNGACNALAAVARTNSDRGTIALLNAYGYRPLLAELEKADAE
jgi:hypothetical protein